MARTIDSTAGNPSGTAATANDTPMSATSTKSLADSRSETAAIVINEGSEIRYLQPIRSAQEEP